MARPPVAQVLHDASHGTVAEPSRCAGETRRLPSLEDLGDASPRPRGDESLPGGRDGSRLEDVDGSRPPGGDGSRRAAPNGSRGPGRDASRSCSTDASRHPRGCAYCGGVIPAGKRRDTKYCSKAHRQAAWRFNKELIAREIAAVPLRLAYADPPYPGLARRYYEGHPDYAGEVDHEQLLSRLQVYDGWALSTSSRALPGILALCVAAGLDVRVACWVRGERKTPSRWPLCSWEPVVFAGGRRQVSAAAASDALIHHARPRTTDPHRVIGSKPAAFCAWLFDLLGARPGDQLDDLFPGSGGVARAWDIYNAKAL